MAERAGLDDRQTDEAAWTVTHGAPGEVATVGGPKAVALALAVAWGTRLPLLPWSVPGMGWLLARVYRLIASNRHRLPGDTPWCVEHDAACAPPE